MGEGHEGVGSQFQNSVGVQFYFIQEYCISLATIVLRPAQPSLNEYYRGIQRFKEVSRNGGWDAHCSWPAQE